MNSRATSIHSDRAADARAAAASAKRRSGAPPGPRLLPVVTYDDDGQFTIFTGRTCAECGVQLTSRNRYGQATMCQEHGRQKDTERTRRRRASKPRERPAERPGGSSEDQPEGPSVQRIRRAFESFLTNPTDPVFRDQFIKFVERHAFECELIEALSSLPQPIRGNAAPERQP